MSFMSIIMNMSAFPQKRKEVGAATSGVQEKTTDVVDAMDKMTLGHEFEAILDLVQELVERLNYLAVRVEEVHPVVMNAPVDP